MTSLLMNCKHITLNNFPFRTGNSMTQEDDNVVVEGWTRKFPKEQLLNNIIRNCINQNIVHSLPLEIHFNFLKCKVVLSLKPPPLSYAIKNIIANVWKCYCFIYMQAFGKTVLVCICYLNIRELKEPWWRR